MPLPLKDQENIYKLFNEEHLGIMDIVEKTGHAFETVAKYSQKVGEMKLGPKKFKILKPYFDRIDEVLIAQPNISIKNVLLPYLHSEGYKGRLTALKDYCRMRKPMLHEERNPSLIEHIEEQAAAGLIIAQPAPPKPVKVNITHVLEEKYRSKIERDMRDEHPWIPEKEMLSRIRRLGYTGKVTMMGNYMREIRPIILKEFFDRGILADKVNSILLREPGMIHIVHRVLTKIIKELVRDQLLNPMDIVIPNDQQDSKLSKWLRIGNTRKRKANKIRTISKHHTVKPKVKGRIYIKIKAFKVLEDGTIFESEEQVLNHIELLKIDKNIDAFTSTLPATMSNEEVNQFIKKFARGEGL